jgi:hypothetical protein
MAIAAMAMAVMALPVINRPGQNKNRSPQLQGPPATGSELLDISYQLSVGGCANKLTPWYELIGRLTP